MNPRLSVGKSKTFAALRGLFSITLETLDGETAGVRTDAPRPHDLVQRRDGRGKRLEIAEAISRNLLR